jgi:hypothetical protein
MLNLVLLYLPSLIGLVFATWQLIVLLQLARAKQSLASSMLLAIVVMSTGVLLSWFVVLAMAYALVAFGINLLSFLIATLPIFWAIVLVYINRGIRE